MLIVGNAQEYSLYFFSGGGTYALCRCREKSRTVPTKSLWRLAIPRLAYHVLQFHHLLISYTEKHTYTCAMEMLSCLI